MRRVALAVRGGFLLLILGLIGASVALIVSPTRVMDAISMTDVLTRRSEHLTGRQILELGSGSIGILTVILFVTARWFGATADESIAPLVSERGRAPESTSVDPMTVAGSDFDSAIVGVETLDEARKYRPALAETVTALLEQTPHHGGAAEPALEDGSWTDDALAAGFLSGSQPTPLRARFRRWLDEEAEAKRRLRRTIAAIDACRAAPGEDIDE